MGALHPGHIGLISNAALSNDLVVCSIFINPSQFNDKNDFEKYPKTLENDIYLLAKAGCDVLFLPSVMDMYPDGLQSKMHYELGHFENVLEGKYRPGHFQGVCQVVHRLLEIVQPTNLYVGQKDFQQCMVLKKLINLLEIKTTLVVCPTLREQDGLAMSSRNLRLSPVERSTAPAIYEALLEIKNKFPARNLAELKNAAIDRLTAKGFKVDYIEFAGSDELNIKNEYDGKDKLVVLAAAYLNEVRLIDNVLLN